MEATGEMPAPSVSFKGISNIDGYFPPDTNGAVGKDHYVQMVNVSTQIFDKQGHSLYGPFRPNNLWPEGDYCNRMNDGDVIVLYDQLADRWLLSQFGIRDGMSGGDYYECIAVSKGPTPTNMPSDWYPYSFLVHSTLMNDYPKISVWPDGYYMTANQFDNKLAWAGVGIWVFDREKMLTGQAATFQYRDLLDQSIDVGPVLPASLLGLQQPPTGSPDYALTVDDGTFTWDGNARIMVFAVSSRWPGGMTVSVANDLLVAPFTWVNSGIPQKGTNVRLDPISDRLMMHAYYRNLGGYEALTASHTVDAGGGRAGIRWYELRKYRGQADWQVYQQGTYAPPDSINRWMGSLAMDRQGNIALGYSVSGTDLYPGIRYTGRLASDPSGSMTQAEQVMVNGGGYQSRMQNGTGRWGDYSAMSLDPVDDCTFWYTNEYMPYSGIQPWSTWIGAFTFPGCTVTENGMITGKVIDSVSGLPVEGASLYGYSDPPGYFFQATSGTGGLYGTSAPAGTYTLIASAFGYSTQEYTDLSIQAGETTTWYVVLTAGPMHTLNGVVLDAVTGWPVYASIQIDGYPGAPVWNNPQNGFYSISLPEDIDYTLQVQTFSPGYQANSLSIGKLTANKIVDVYLQPDLTVCNAPGYLIEATGCQAQVGGLVVGNVFDLNTGKGLNGAQVSVMDGESVFTLATPGDPYEPDGFYILFSSKGTHSLQASYSPYVAQTKIVSVNLNKSIRQDFRLPAGRLYIQPASLSASAGVGAVVELPLNLTNTGTAPLDFTIAERDPAFAPANLAYRRSYNPPIQDTDNNSAVRLLDSPVGAGTVIQEMDLAAITHHVCLLGIEYALGSYWVTSGGQTSCSDPNTLIEVSPSGQVLNSYPEDNDFSTFGWGDLAFDGAYLYASHSNAILQVDPLNGQPTGVTIPAPVNPVRALAYNPENDHFWVANQTSGIFEIDRTGAIINHWTNLLNIYGLAFDPSAPGGAALWAWSQDGDPLVLANRIDPQTGKVLASFSRQVVGGSDQAGGATFTDSLVNGKRVLLTLQQAASDSLVGYDLEPVYQADLPWITPMPASGTIGSSDTLPVTVILQSSQAGVLKADLLVNNDTPYGTIIIPVTFTVTGQTLSTPTLTRTILPGFTAVYTMTISNGSPIPDTFDLSLGSAVFPAELSQALIEVGAWRTAEFQVLVHVPAAALNGDQDSVTVIADSHINPGVNLEQTLVTQVVVRRYYFPLVTKSGEP